MNSPELRGLLLLGALSVAACGEEEPEEEWTCADYTMEEFWTDYYTIYCAYEAECLVDSGEPYDQEGCVEALVGGELSWCDEAGFSACDSWDCAQAWQAEVDTLEAAGQLEECPSYWNLPWSEECDRRALMESYCNTVVDE